MERPGPLFLVDARGVPFPDGIQEVLETLVPRLLRQFSHLDDPLLLIEVLEETGERILRRQSARGTLCRPYGFAWVTARNVALSRLRLSRVKLVRRTLSTDDAAPHLATLQASEAAPSVDGSKPAISWTSKPAISAGRRDGLSSTAVVPPDASRCAPWSASCGGRT